MDQARQSFDIRTSKDFFHKLEEEYADFRGHPLSARHAIMQSIFSPAARRDTRREEGNLDRRGGELKMDWTKPLHDARAMCFDCRFELW